MLFDNIEEMKAAGFSGFQVIENLMSTDCAVVPKKSGVYFVLYIGDRPSGFLKVSEGGHFKGRNPTVPIDDLKSSWVTGSKVVYIGKAGGENSNATLRSRLKQYMRFGCDRPVGHWGGRHIWQLKENRSLVICWKPVAAARKTEKELLRRFQLQYNMLPFANLVS